jgi:hypothetical protein
VLFIGVFLTVEISRAETAAKPAKDSRTMFITTKLFSPSLH